MIGRLPRITVGWLMLFVSLAAVDLALIRRPWEMDTGILYVALPMANVLIFAGLLAWNRPEARPFWGGFMASGIAVMALFGYLSWAHGETFFWPANAVYPWSTIRNRTAQLAYLVFIDAVCYTPPQVLVAWLGGRAVEKFVSRSGPGPIEELAAPPPG